MAQPRFAGGAVSRLTLRFSGGALRRLLQPVVRRTSFAHSRRSPDALGQNAAASNVTLPTQTMAVAS
jgi:hypothetical protein